MPRWLVGLSPRYDDSLFMYMSASSSLHGSGKATIAIDPRKGTTHVFLPSHSLSWAFMTFISALTDATCEPDGSDDG